MKIIFEVRRTWSENQEYKVISTNITASRDNGSIPTDEDFHLVRDFIEDLIRTGNIKAPPNSSPHSQPCDGESLVVQTEPFQVPPSL